jgi:CBS domain-containing protein
VLAFALGCVERMRRQNLTNLPVTNSDGRLVGLLLRADAEQALEAIRSNAEAARPSA